MDVLEAIRNRHSVRAFLPEPVSQETLRSILEVATRAPSWANSQPWELVVAGGRVVEEIKRRYRQAMAEGKQGGNLEVPRPENWPSYIEERIFAGGQAMYEAMGVSREGREGRRRFREEMNLLAGAPQGIFLCLDRSLGEWSMFDLGAICQTIMLAAQGYGLDTCPAVAFVHYPEILHELLEIPATKKIVVGIAIGYADPQAPVNTYRSSRVPLDEVVKWHGFS